MAIFRNNKSLRDFMKSQNSSLSFYVNSKGNGAFACGNVTGYVTQEALKERDADKLQYVEVTDEETGVTYPTICKASEGKEAVHTFTL